VAAKSSFLLCHVRYLQKISLAAPKSFMAKDSQSIFFNLSIPKILFPTISMSSKYNNKIIKSLENFLAKAWWSKVILLLITINDLNLYHYLLEPTSSLMTLLHPIHIIFPTFNKKPSRCFLSIFSSKLKMENCLHIHILNLQIKISG